MSPRRKPPTCGADDCIETPSMGGLCRKHHEEQNRREERRESALRCLHTRTVADQILTDLSLREELQRLCRWWDDACFAVRTGQDYGCLPLDEARFAMEWCITLAAEIAEAELAIRAGKKPASSLGATHCWVWDRFANLEKGLMSNGIPRPQPRCLPAVSLPEPRRRRSTLNPRR